MDGWMEIELGLDHRMHAYKANNAPVQLLERVVQRLLQGPRAAEPVAELLHRLLRHVHRGSVELFFFCVCVRGVCPFGGGGGGGGET